MSKPKTELTPLSPVGTMYIKVEIVIPSKDIANLDFDNLLCDIRSYGAAEITANHPVAESFEAAHRIIKRRAVK